MNDNSNDNKSINGNKINVDDLGFREDMTPEQMQEHFNNMPLHQKLTVVANDTQCQLSEVVGACSYVMLVVHGTEDGKTDMKIVSSMPPELVPYVLDKASKHIVLSNMPVDTPPQ